MIKSQVIKIRDPYVLPNDGRNDLYGTRSKTAYERLGFTQLGTIPGGFWMKDGRYENIYPY